MPGNKSEDHVEHSPEIRSVFFAKCFGENVDLGIKSTCALSV